MHDNIYKYELNLVNRQNVVMPLGSEIISAQEQRDKICLWAKVNTKAKPSNRLIEINGTGIPLPSMNPDQNRRHIDTVQVSGFVWHVFEII